MALFPPFYCKTSPSSLGSSITRLSTTTFSTIFSTILDSLRSLMAWTRAARVLSYMPNSYDRVEKSAACCDFNFESSSWTRSLSLMTFSIISACTACLDLHAKSEQTPVSFGAAGRCITADFFFYRFCPFFGFFFSLDYGAGIGEESSC